MKKKIEFNNRTNGLMVLAIFTLATLAIYIYVGTGEFTDGALFISWLFFSWNYYAYSFNKRMWPPQLEELHGDGKGKASWRTFWFWLAVLIYGMLLVTILWARLKG
jgi:hypothetical protein